MNNLLQKLADQCRTEYHDGHGGFTEQFDEQKFAELLIRECVNTLEFHGFDDAIPYVKWMATNKLGVLE